MAGLGAAYPTAPSGGARPEWTQRGAPASFSHLGLRQNRHGIAGAEKPNTLNLVAEELSRKGVWPGGL